MFSLLGQRLYKNIVLGFGRLLEDIVEFGRLLEDIDIYLGFSRLLEDIEPCLGFGHVYEFGHVLFCEDTLALAIFFVFLVWG